MELTDLVGLHRLSGVDMNHEGIAEEWGESYGDCQVINFVLDGITYTAIEDPSDGYRSMMSEIKQSQVIVKNRFREVLVYGVMRPDRHHANDVLDFYDTKSNKIVLSIGTEDVDDYYPIFVAEFTPENIGQ